MKAVTKMLSPREKRMIQFIVKNGYTTVKRIAAEMAVSEKTVSRSLQVIDSFLTASQLVLVRKPKIGIYIEGDKQTIRDMLKNIDQPVSSLPQTKEERVVYIFIKLLKTTDFITIQMLADELFISRGTIEKDMAEVTNMLEKEGVTLYKKPSKGMKLRLTEQERRSLTSKLINHFWGDNWYLKQENGKVRQAFEQIEVNLTGIFPTDGLKEIIDVVHTFSREKNFAFTDYAFESLVIHLAIALERIKSADYIEALQVSPVKNLVMTQKENTRYLVELLEARFELEIPAFEADYIQIHLSAAYNQWNDELIQPSSLPENDDFKQFVESTLTGTAYDFELIEGLATHLKSALNRLKLGMNFTNPFLSKIKQNFPLAFEQALRVKVPFEKKFHVHINEDESAYIALHFEAFYERTKSQPEGLNVALVCSTGLGSSQLLAARIKKYFKNLTVTAIFSVQKIMEEPNIEADLIISTIYLDLHSAIPVIVVSPMMTESDLANVSKQLQIMKPQERKQKNSFLKQLIHEELLFPQLELTTLEEVLAFIAERLVQSGYAEPGVLQSAIQREQLSYTSFHGLATPHADPALIKQSAIVVATLVHPIQWGEEQVDKVFFLALDENHNLSLDKLYEEFYERIDNKRWLEQVTDARTIAALNECLVKDEM